MKIKNSKIKLKGFALIVAILFMGFVQAVAQELDPVSWEISVGSRTDNELVMSYKATIDEGWHIYALTVSDDPEAMGPFPTEIVVEESDNLESIGKLTEEKKPISSFDKAFDMELFYHEGTVEFSQVLTTKNKDLFSLQGDIIYMACDDEKCIFPDPLKFVIIIE